MASPRLRSEQGQLILLRFVKASPRGHCGVALTEKPEGGVDPAEEVLGAGAGSPGSPR